MKLQKIISLLFLILIFNGLSVQQASAQTDTANGIMDLMGYKYDFENTEYMKYHLTIIRYQPSHTFISAGTIEVYKGMYWQTDSSGFEMQNGVHRFKVDTLEKVITILPRIDLSAKLFGVSYNDKYFMDNFVKRVYSVGDTTSRQVYFEFKDEAPMASYFLNIVSDAESRVLGFLTQSEMWNYQTIPKSKVMGTLVYTGDTPLPNPDTSLFFRNDFFSVENGEFVLKAPYTYYSLYNTTKKDL